MPQPIDLEKWAEDCVLGPDDELPPRRSEAKAKAKRERLPRAADPFVRIWISRWADSRLYSPHARLYHVLVHLSREGRKNPVELTVAVAEMADISPRHRARLARRLEKLGLVHIERRNQGLLMVTVIPDPIVTGEG
jgi:hypothetical protein